MKQTDMTWKQASPCSAKRLPVPESIVCNACKAETEVWSDEDEAACHSCGGRIAADRGNNTG